MIKIIFLISICFFWMIIFSKNPRKAPIFETPNINNKTETQISTTSQKDIPSFWHKIFELDPKTLVFWSWWLASWEKLVINWPLLWEDFLPVWGYVSWWRQIKKFFSIKNKSANFWLDNWIFWYWLDWKFYLDYSSNYKNKKFLWAFQNWPILVLNGKNLRNENSARYPRSWIWYKNWKLVAIFTPQFLTLKEFWDSFVQNWVQNAIYLDWWSPVGYEDQNWKFWNLNSSAIKLHFFD